MSAIFLAVIFLIHFECALYDDHPFPIFDTFRAKNFHEHYLPKQHQFNHPMKAFCSKSFNETSIHYNLNLTLFLHLTQPLGCICALYRKEFPVKPNLNCSATNLINEVSVSSLRMRIIKPIFKLLVSLLEIGNFIRLRREGEGPTVPHSSSIFQHVKNQKRNCSTPLIRTNPK